MMPSPLQPSSLTNHPLPTGSMSHSNSFHLENTHPSPPAGSGLHVGRILGRSETAPYSPYTLIRKGSVLRGAERLHDRQPPSSHGGSARPSRNSSHASLTHSNTRKNSDNHQLSTDFSPYVLWSRNKTPSPVSPDRAQEKSYDEPNTLELNGSASVTQGLTTVGSPTTPHPPSQPKPAQFIQQLFAATAILSHSGDTVAGKTTSRSHSPLPEGTDNEYLDRTVSPAAESNRSGNTTLPPTPSKLGVAASTPLEDGPTIDHPTSSTSSAGLAMGVPIDAATRLSTPQSSPRDVVRSRGPSMLQVDSSQVTPATSRKGTSMGNRGRMGVFNHGGSVADFDAYDWGYSRQVSYANRTVSAAEERRTYITAGAQIEDDGVGNTMIDDYLMSEEPFKKTRHSEVFLADDTKPVMDTPNSAKRAIKKIRLPLVESLSGTTSRTTSHLEEVASVDGGGAHEISDKDLQRLGREISIWKGLSNRYIVPLYKVLISSDKRDAYLVMEFMEGGTLLSLSKVALGEGSDSDCDNDAPSTLHSRMRVPRFTREEKDQLAKCGIQQYKPLPIADIKRYIEQLSGALTYLHGKGITHYDVKPENILLCADKNGRNEVRLTDFGTSELQGERAAPQLDVVPSESESISMPTSPLLGAATRMASMGFRKNFIKGTHKFLAPEAFLPMDDRSPPTDTRPLDMWALGITLFAMATGYFPFKGTNVNAIRDSVTNDTPYYPSSMDRALVYLCERLLRKDPAKRWTAEKLYATLHKRRMDGALNKPKSRGPSAVASVPSVRNSSSTTATTPTPTHRLLHTNNVSPTLGATVELKQYSGDAAARDIASIASGDIPLFTMASPESRKRHQLNAARIAAAADPQNLVSAPPSRLPSSSDMPENLRTQSQRSTATDNTNLDAREVESVSSLPPISHRSHGVEGNVRRVCSSQTDREEEFEVNEITAHNPSQMDCLPSMAISISPTPVNHPEDEAEPSAEEGTHMQSSGNSVSDILSNDMSFDGGTSFALTREQQAWVMEQVLKEARQGGTSPPNETE